MSSHITSLFASDAEIRVKQLQDCGILLLLRDLICRSATLGHNIRVDFWIMQKLGNSISTAPLDSHVQCCLSFVVLDIKVNAVTVQK